MSRASIGEFEQLVLLAILRLGDDAYGIPILEVIRERTGRRVLRPAVYVALRRLQQKGLVESRDAHASDDRDGRVRRYFSVSADGLERLKESRRALQRMSQGLDDVLDER